MRTAFGDEGGLLTATFRRPGFGDYVNLQSAFAGLRLHGELGVDERLDQVVDFAHRALASVAGLIPALQQAAATEPRVRRLVDVARERRGTTSAEIVRMVSRDERPAPDAIELVYARVSGETYLQYVEELGHPAAEYGAWLRRCLDRMVNA